MSATKKIGVGIFGRTGRMGAELSALLMKSATFTIVDLFEDQKRLKTTLSKPDIVIDFSSPSGSKTISKFCGDQKIPLVSGTTGLSPADEKNLKTLGKKIAVFRSANMSLGVNAMARALTLLTEDLKDFDIQIEEIHHRHKKDSPSGTAQFLKSKIEKSSGAKLFISPTVSVRAGEVFGIHKVYFFSKSEWLCIEHHAMNRTVFAEGALKAAQWLVKKKPGFYTMDNLLSSMVAKK